ncbi:MAG: amidase [Gemmatimonadetes bacterium]|nr:amidase [Gemmatimonadota bacterium]
MGVAVLAGKGAALPPLSHRSDRAVRNVVPPPLAVPQVASPAEWTLAEGLQAVRDGEVSATEWAEACLARIRRQDGVLKAFNAVPHGQVLEQARALDDVPRRGILHGAPLAIKDNYATAGITTTANSLIFEDWVPEFDATTVERLKGAGCVVLGKTQMGPLATTRATTPDGTRTTVYAWAPNNDAVSPGGSSSGSATSVAARLAASSTGTQTGGSITVPSIAQGLTGLKPTMGRVSLNGIIPLTYTRDHPGPIARDAMDAALMLQVMAGADSRDPRTQGLPPVPDYVRAATVQRPGMLRWPVTIGVTPDYLDEGEDGEDRVRAAARRNMLDTFRSLGALVRDVPWPEQWEVLTSFNLNNVRLPERTEPFLPYLKGDVRLFGVSLSPWINGLLLSGDEYLKGQRAKLALLDRILSTFFVDCDVVVLNRHLAFDMVGLPLIAFPIGFDESEGHRLPVGGLIGGKPFSEERLLSLVAGYQSVTEHHRARPVDAVRDGDDGGGSARPGAGPRPPSSIRPAAAHQEAAGRSPLRLTLTDVDREGE